MREIKFRAWQKVGNETYDYTKPMTVRYKELTFSLAQLNGLFNVEQFTGLRDKNGRKIYESDILRVADEDGESYVATVKWFGDEGYPAFDLEGIPATRFYDANALSTILNSGAETCEVIGNIHDKPELLEEEK